jgi:hypothetical protein
MAQGWTVRLLPALQAEGGELMATDAEIERAIQDAVHALHETCVPVELTTEQRSAVIGAMAALESMANRLLGSDSQCATDLRNARLDASELWESESGGKVWQ